MAAAAGTPALQARPCPWGDPEWGSLFSSLHLGGPAGSQRSNPVYAAAASNRNCGPARYSQAAMPGGLGHAAMLGQAPPQWGTQATNQGEPGWHRRPGWGRRMLPVKLLKAYNKLVTIIYPMYWVIRV